MKLRGQALGYRRIVILLVALVVVPTFLMLAVGILLLFLGGVELNLLMGILVVALSGAAATGVILVWVFVRREANLSALQSDFVSKVSHELRTPLTSIRLFADTLALRRGDPAAEDQCIDGLERETNRLQELIDRLLDWGRMESGAREFEFEPTDAGAVARAAARAFDSVRARRSAELELSLPESKLPIVADRGAIVDALVNLLTNAHKYGGDAGRIRLSAAAVGEEVRLSVADDGPGIEKSEHKRIFQKFYRVDDRLSREREGTGLGLAIVKHVMRAHRGRVELASVRGKGSTFTLIIPRAAK
jgi:two-component system phosphate regulon sensor histidine kinase PhoR